MEIEVELSPYSFSRVNYENSLLIYNKIFQIGEIKIFTTMLKSQAVAGFQESRSQFIFGFEFGCGRSSVFSFDIFKGGKKTSPTFASVAMSTPHLRCWRRTSVEETILLPTALFPTRIVLPMLISRRENICDLLRNPNTVRVSSRQ